MFHVPKSVGFMKNKMSQINFFVQLQYVPLHR